MTETCDICGRERSIAACWGGTVKCYQIAHEKARARLSAAEERITEHKRIIEARDETIAAADAGIHRDLEVSRLTANLAQADRLLTTAEKENTRLKEERDAALLLLEAEGLPPDMERAIAERDDARAENTLLGELARGMARLTGELAEALERARQEFDSVESYVSSLRSVANAVLAEHPAPTPSGTAPAVANKASDSSAPEKALGALRAIMRLARCDVGHELAALDRIYEAGWNALNAALPDPSGGAHVDGPKADPEAK